jgi:hypothetical protein
MVCTRITDWIEEKVSRPVSQWVERQEKKCKKLKWYDPRRWLCWLTTTVVKVLRWVVVNLVKAVITIVCRLIARILAILVDILEFLYLLVKSLITWDKCVLQEALSKLGDALLGAFTLLGHVLIDPFVRTVNAYRLRGYVRQQIESRFEGQGQTIEALKEAFHVDHGVFGLRTTCTVHRMFVDSEARTERYPDVPNLIGLHQDGHIDLYKLAGFSTPCELTSTPGWYRPRPQTAKFPFASGGGIGEPTPPSLTRDELTEYIESGGEKGFHFLIYAISQRNLDLRIDTASEKARQLGLIMEFERRDIGVVHEDHIRYSASVQTNFLIQQMGRRDDSVDPELARFDLCAPAAVAVFGFENRNSRGYTSNSVGTTECAAYNLADARVSGVSFIDDIPDEVRRYVLVHELGHYFGLCHVDGFSRIMVSGAEGQGDAFTWGSIPGFLGHGGPRFTLDEAKQVWRFILAHFPVDCLLGREPPIAIVVR